MGGNSKNTAIILARRGNIYPIYHTIFPRSSVSRLKAETVNDLDYNGPSSSLPSSPTSHIIILKDIHFIADT
jgi:hypothetical protein